MRMYGVPYRITSTVTAVTPDHLFEWRHPLGHRWRWEFHATSPTSTRVTETFDYRDAGAVKNRLKYYEATGFRQTECSRHRRHVTSTPRPVHQLILWGSAVPAPGRQPTPQRPAVLRRCRRRRPPAAPLRGSGWTTGTTGRPPTSS
jgi:hypothetical protein